VRQGLNSDQFSKEATVQMLIVFARDKPEQFQTMMLPALQELTAIGESRTKQEVERTKQEVERTKQEAARTAQEARRVELLKLQLRIKKEDLKLLTTQQRGGR
jgi:hypothetical protein